MSVKVVRERSDQRRHHRVTAPLFVAYDGHRMKATDWSLGGLRLDGFPGTLPDIGATIPLDVSIPFQGFDVNFKCQAEVVRRIEDSRTVAVKYTDIGERELGLMEHFIDELIRGSMVDVKETIQRIDVPVTPASTKPDPNPLSRVPISRWPTKTIAFAALYLTIGLFVFGYAAVIAYTNFVRMEVDSAVIASPIESVRSQVNGRIIYGKYRQGDRVPKGALLLSVVDNDLERQIDMASIDIKDKSAQKAALDRQLIEELERVTAFSKVEDKNLDQITLEIQSLEAQAKAAQALHQRLAHLFKQGFTTATQVESAEKQMIAAQKLAQAKGVELQTRRSLATYNAGSRLYNGQGFSGDRAKIESQAFLAREHVSVAEKKLQALLDHRDRLAVYAPYAGLLQELPRADGSMVRTGDVLAVVENPKSREIWAFLRQDEVLSVGLGDEVGIYLPGLSELRKAKVMRIDRTIGFVNEMNSTYVWRGPRDRSAKVILEFADTGKRAQDDNYRTGMPAVAIFSTRPTNYLIGDMMHRFRMVFGGRPRKPAEEKAIASEQAREKEAQTRQAQAVDTPGASRKDRLGPPRNYEPTSDPLHDPDAVTARRAAELVKPVVPVAAPLEAPMASEAAPDVARHKTWGQITDGAAELGNRVRGLFVKPEDASRRAADLRQSNTEAAPVEPPRAEVQRAPAPTIPPKPKRFRDDIEPPAEAPIAAPASVPRSQAEAPLARPTRPHAEAKPGAIGAWPQADAASTARAANPRPPIPALEPPQTKPALPAPIRIIKPAERAAPRSTTNGDDNDDEPEVAGPLSKAGTTRPVTAPQPSTQTALGFFARMKERLRTLLTVKPSDDDDDWGDEEGVAGQSEPETRAHSRGTASKVPEDAISRDRVIEPPAAKPAPSLKPAAPAAQRRPTTAMRILPDADPELPAWQARLRRATLAESAR